MKKIYSPTTDCLRKIFLPDVRCQRQTVRTALKRLKNEHHLYTLPGKGNFVSPPKYKEETELLASFSEGWKSEGKTSSKVIEFSLIDASLSVSTNLQIEFGEKVYKLERARCINDEYITIETIRISIAKTCTGLISQRTPFMTC